MSNNRRQTGTFSDPEKEGWVWKQGGRIKSWKHRWFLITNHCLYYFLNPTDSVPRGIIPLENILVRDATDEQKPYCLELYIQHSGIIKACKSKSKDGKFVKGKHTVYRMSASTPEEREDWIKCIRQSICHSPSYDITGPRIKKGQKNSSNPTKS